MGEKIVYIKSKLVINNTKLEQLLQVLSVLSSVSQDNNGESKNQDQNMNLIENEIQKAILTAQGPMARM